MTGSKCDSCGAPLNFALGSCAYCGTSIPEGASPKGAVGLVTPVIMEVTPEYMDQTWLYPPGVILRTKKDGTRTIMEEARK